MNLIDTIVGCAIVIPGPVYDAEEVGDLVVVGPDES